MKKNTPIQWLLFFLFYFLASSITRFIISIGWGRIAGEVVWETFGQLNGYFISGTLWVFFREAFSAGVGIFGALQALSNRVKALKVTFWIWAIVSVVITIAITLIAALEVANGLELLDMALYSFASIGGWGMAVFTMRELAEAKELPGDLRNPIKGPKRIN